jgi:hypothetical protein
MGGGRKGGKPDQSAILMASLFGEGDEDEDMPQQRRYVWHNLFIIMPAK